MREAAERVRLEREDLAAMLASGTGGGALDSLEEVSHHGRLAADWLERYGAPLVKTLMPATWSVGMIAVDGANTFNIGARYPDDHPEKPGRPFPAEP